MPKKGANVLKAHPGDGKAETLIRPIKPVDEPAFQAGNGQMPVRIFTSFQASFRSFADHPDNKQAGP